jgi:nitroreductase
VEFFEVVNQRRSIRVFTPDQIEESSLEKILHAANRAPSAGNLQGYGIYLVRDAHIRNRLARAALDQEFIAQASVVLVFCAHPARSSGRYGHRGETLYALQDATIACTYAMLAATALGLGSVWVGAFHEDGVRHAIGLPPGFRPVALLPIGYPAENPYRTSRRDLKELVHEI